MAYWIFKCNPKLYRLADRLADPAERTTWLATRYRDEIKPGDIAFIWKTGRDRGICAVMAIDSSPRMMEEIRSEKSFYISSDIGQEWRVEGRFIQRGPYISGAELRLEPGLEDLSVFHGYQQATNFRVTDAEGRILKKLVSSRS